MREEVDYRDGSASTSVNERGIRLLRDLLGARKAIYIVINEDYIFFETFHLKKKQLCLLSLCIYFSYFYKIDFVKNAYVVRRLF